MFDQLEAEGTAFGSSDDEGFRCILCVVPLSELVERFQAFCSTLDDQRERGERDSHILKALREALLPKLIFGELRVKDAERLAEKRGL